MDTFNGTSDDDTINVAAGTYTLSGAALDNANASGDLDITKTGGSLTIQGAGTGSTIIDANDVDRVVHITGATTVTLADLTIQNGATDDDGTTSGQALGGGILISGAADVTLDNVAVTSNTATGTAGVANGSAGEAAYGGGFAIVNAGASLTLTDTSVTANTAVGGAGQTGISGGSWTNGQAGGQGGAAGGGAVYVSGGEVAVTGTSSLTSNSATGGYGGTGGQGGYTTVAGWQGATGGTGGNASGGGAFVSSGSLSVPTSAAITSNSAVGGDGGNGGAGGSSMTVGSQGNGGNGGSARGGGAYFTDGNMAAIQSGAVSTNSLTAGWAGTGYLSGSNGSTSDTNAGRQASTLSVTVEQAGGQADPATSSPVEFTVTFSESVSDFATGDVTIAGTTGATTATVTGSGTTYTVAVSGMTSNGWVSAYVPAGVATNAGATPNGAAASTDNVVVLSGGDFTAPTISSTTPADNATGVAVAADLEVVFNENVAKGTGNISIYDNSDTLFEAIDVTSSKVSISGDTVTINPTNSLALGTSYYVQIAATAIEDTSGNTFAGIADKTTWNFTTPDAFTDSGIALAGVGGSSVAWGDYDNDGDLDILLTGADGTVASMVSKIYRNDGSNTFTDIGASFPGLWSSSAVWGDYDNDGDLDALITGRDSSNNILLKLYRNDGSDTFTEVAASLPAVRLGSLSWGDYDNDGDLDLLLTGNDGSGNRHGEIYRNDGSDTFTDIGVSLVKVYVSSVAWGDYDNDGDLDIVLTGQDAGLNRISKIYRNDGSDTFTDIGASLTGMSSGSVAWGDYDNDGDLDLLLSGLDGGANKISKIYRNDGSDTFTDIGASLTGVSESSGVWGDYDNDGDLDLLLAGYADGWVPLSAIYRNDGSDTFTNTNASVIDVHSPSLAWGDYDGDGDLDFLLTGFNSGGFETTRIYRNDSPIANTAPTAPTGLNVAAGSSAGEKTLSWNAATDTKTAQNGLSYNIYIGTTSGDDNVAPAMADLSGGSSDGLRRIATIGPNQGTSWTITSLADGTYYWSVQAVDTALAGSAWATEGTFTVDSAAPTISSTTPADNATGVDPTANLSITFDENVAKGTGNISIYDSGDNLVEAIDVTSGQVTVSDATVTINPTNSLADLTSYYVQIDATAIDDTSGNSFAGISDKTTWSFTTADTTAPTISSTTPADNANGVDPTANLSITFNENVAKGTGNISIYDSSDNLVEAIDVTSGQVTDSGATVTINPTNSLADLTSYYVQIDATAIGDTSGNSFAGISNKTTWSFTTADTTGPTISNTTPADNATGVDPTANLSITFDENVAKGTGSISIYDSGNNLVEAIDVTSGQVNVLNATVTINPTNALADLTSYYVQIDATAIDDTSGNSFAGISDKTTWSFTTADTTGPTISSTTPADNATGVDPTANLSITFDENVAKGTGNISIYDSSDNLVEAIDVTSGQVTVSGATMTINPTNSLAGLTSYYVQIDATAIDDTSGNSFAGISDTTTWSFTTADTIHPADLGSIDYRQLSDLDATAESYYVFETTYAGQLSLVVENRSSGTTSLELLDNSRSALTSDATRINWDVASGETYYFQLTGAATDVDVAIVNLVDDRTGDVVVYGTSGDDDFVFRPVGSDAIESYFVAINGVEYQVASGQLATIAFDGGDGNDTAELTGTSGDDHVGLSPGTAELTTQAYTATVAHTKSITVAGGSGTTDVAELSDSEGDDTFAGSASGSTMTGTGYRNTVTGFEYTHVYARAGGYDTAELDDTAGDDFLMAEANAQVPVAKLIDSEGFVRTKFFDVTRANAVNGGTDEAWFYDSAGDDHFAGGPGLSTMTTDACTQSAEGFDVVHAYALSGGMDVAELTDSSDDDTVVATDQYMKIFGDGFFVRAKRFDAAHAYARNGGNDSARLFGTSRNEKLFATDTWTKMVGPTSMQRVKFFDSVAAYGNGGTDQAYLYDSPGNDLLDSTATTATLTTPGSRNVALDFDWVRASSENGGTDYDRSQAVDFALETVGNWIREAEDPAPTTPTTSSRSAR